MPRFTVWSSLALCLGSAVLLATHVIRTNAQNSGATLTPSMTSTTSPVSQTSIPVITSDATTATATTPVATTPAATSATTMFVAPTADASNDISGGTIAIIIVSVIVVAALLVLVMYKTGFLK